MYPRYAGGLIGPMIIHGPQTVPYDIGKLVHLQRLSRDWSRVIASTFTT
jgi:hypothetical protein